MTKHTDSSRSTDSGVSGNDQTGAKEIRLPEIDGYFVESETKWLRLPNGNLIDTEATAAEIAFYAECSCLASRVAILESALLQAVSEIADYRGVYQDPDTCEQKIAAGVQRRIADAEKSLAGAHAEEKS